MIPRRIWINLAAFGALFVWLCLWAVQNIIKFDAIERPYTITASFDSAPGLRENVEVTYLGVRVGTIKGLDLDDGHVVVRLGIDRDVDLPVGISAAIRRKSAVGEPYVALDPPEGYEGGAKLIDPDADYAIDDGAVPLSYGDLFVSLDELVDSVPGDALATVLDELATALDGRGPALRQLLESGDDLTGTLAERTELFDQLAGDLTRLTHTIATEKDSVGRSFDNLAAITGTLAASRDDLDLLLDEAPEFGRQVNALLQETIDDLGCTFASVGSLFDRIGQPSKIEELLRVLDVAAAANFAFNESVIEAGDHGADGPYLTGSFGLTAGDPPPLYDPRPELPVPPAIPRCGSIAPEELGSSGSQATATGEGEGPSEQGDVDVSHRPAPVAPDLPESSPARPGDERFPLALAVGLSALVLVAIPVWVHRARRERPLTEEAD